MAEERASPMDAALKVFEATEANLTKAETLWSRIEKRTPQGMAFGEDPEYEDLCRSFAHVLTGLPAIDGFRPTDEPMQLNEIRQMRFDAAELGEPSAIVDVEEVVSKPGRELRAYRFRLDMKRRELIRDSLSDLMNSVDELLDSLSSLLETEDDRSVDAPNDERDRLTGLIDQIDMLLGSSVARPDRWGDLRRHLHFGLVCDLHDIITMDWPDVRQGITDSLYGTHEPGGVTCGL